MPNDEGQGKITAILRGGVRSIAASFPGAASLATAWNEWETSRRFERVEEFIKDVKSDIDRTGDHPPDDPEGARQLLELVAEMVQREHREEKRRRFARFYVKNAFGEVGRSFDQKRFFLDILDRIGEEDLRILGLFAQRSPIRGDQIQRVVDLGSEDFDVTDVDVTTLRFGPGNTAPGHNLISAFTYNDHLQDVNLDGHMDLVSHYRIRGTAISCGDESAKLTGETINGRTFEGSDSIRTVGCRYRVPLPKTSSDVWVPTRDAEYTPAPTPI